MIKFILLVKVTYTCFLRYSSVVCVGSEQIEHEVFSDKCNLSSIQSIVISFSWIMPFQRGKIIKFYKYCVVF